MLREVLLVGRTRPTFEGRLMKRVLLILALLAVVGLPFLLRPKQVTTHSADETLVVITPHN